MHPKHQHEFDNLADRVVSTLRRRPAIFVINPGNWGDALIREGAERFLRHYDIDYVAVHLKDFEKKRLDLNVLKRQIGHNDPVMIYNGCGAFTKHYPSLVGRVQRLAVHFSTVMVMPSTINIDMRLDQFPSDTHVFVRDRYESQEALPGSLFCHDMAFFLDLLGPAPRKSNGYFFREDREAPLDTRLVPKGEQNKDLSKFGKSQDPIDGLVRGVADYHQVHTNRLHIGIAAALLGRKTLLSGNDYFKIRAIFDSSIRGIFPDVSFINPEATDLRPKSSDTSRL